MRTFPIERARELAREIFDQPHWKIEAARNRWPVSDLVTDVADAIRAAAEEFGQSGGTIPAVGASPRLEPAEIKGSSRGEAPIPPLPDRTGGIDRPKCWFFAQVGPTRYYCSAGPHGHESPHGNGNVAPGATWEPDAAGWLTAPGNGWL